MPIKRQFPNPGTNLLLVKNELIGAGLPPECEDEIPEDCSIVC